MLSRSQQALRHHGGSPCVTAPELGSPGRWLAGPRSGWHSTSSQQWAHWFVITKADLFGEAATFGKCPPDGPENNTGAFVSPCGVTARQASPLSAPGLVGHWSGLGTAASWASLAALDVLPAAFSYFSALLSNPNFLYSPSTACDPAAGLMAAEDGPYPERAWPAAEMSPRVLGEAGEPLLQ